MHTRTIIGNALLFAVLLLEACGATQTGTGDAAPTNLATGGADQSLMATAAPAATANSTVGMSDGMMTNTESYDAHKIRERLLVTGSAVTQLLDMLERRGLVRRIPHPTDRRSVLIEITEQGRRLRESSQPYLKQRDVEWMSGLTVEEQTTLVALLAKVQLHMANVIEPVMPE